MRILLVLMLLVGCAVDGPNGRKFPDPSPDVARFPESLHPFLEEYLEDAADHGVSGNLHLISSIRFVSEFDGYPFAVGMCYYSSRRIELRREILKYSDLQLKAVIYHELGHCALNKPHHRDTISEECVGIMHPKLQSKKSLEKCWNQSVDHLFEVDL